MIKNSYQIFNCNEIQSQFRILRKEDENMINRINEELDSYHKNNEFIIELENKNINEQNVVNNKFIFKNGYYFCSYLYKENEEVYISEPRFETKNNPICSTNSFTNIIIKNRIPLNLKIVGVVYYYKTLTDESECRTSMLYDEEKELIHKSSEKYLIDILYFNSILNNVNYKLSYIFYKNINYDTFIKDKFKNKLNYYYFDKKEDNKFNKLSNTIETKIYNETNTIILNINNTRKKQFILQNLKNITYESTNENNLHNLLSMITKKNSNTILDCKNNIYSKHLVRVEQILKEIDNIINKLTKFINYRENVVSKYTQIFDSIYNLPDFSQILLNPNDPTVFEEYKEKFKTVIEFRGKESDPTEKTLYGLKTLILNLLDDIDENIRELNNNIILLRTKIGNSVQENNELIDKFLNTVQEYIKLEIDMIKVNENKPKNTQLEIFMQYKNKICTVLENKILTKYQKIVRVEENYNINEIPDIFSLLQTLEDFKINKNNIIEIFNNIDIFYNNLDTPFDDLPTYKTLYDIFFNKRNTYEEYLILPHKDFKNFIKPFISKTGEKIQLNYNKIFKSLPKQDEQMQKLDKNKSFDLNNIKESNSSKNINIENYCNKYSMETLKNLKLNYSQVKQKAIFSKNILTNICRTNIIIEEYKKNIENFITTAKFDMNTYKAQRKAKNLENLPVNYRKGIEDFINIHKISFSIVNKYLTDSTYNISNTSYNMAIETFNTFISSIIEDEEIPIDDMDLINVFYTLKNCFFMIDKDYQTVDDFIVIVYSLCISLLTKYPHEMLANLFYIYDTNTNVKNLFDNVFHNKLYIYKTKNINIQTGTGIQLQNNLKIISSLGDIILSEHTLTKNNMTETLKKLNYLKSELINELKKERFINIRKKLSVIQQYINHSVSSNINTLKLATNRGNYSVIDKYFKIIEKMSIINNANNINDIINLNNYYSIKNNLQSNTYCIDLDSNLNYQCGPCDNTNRNPLLKLRSNSCPPNLPYNLDIYIDSHISSELGFNKDTYRIMSFISEPNKELIYKNNSSIKYGLKGRNDSYVWEVNKGYKNYTILDKTDTNEDETVIIKACLNNDIDEHPEKTSIVTDNLDKLAKNDNEFYLNNFYIENILLEDLKNEEWVKFPNSHQLYIQKPTKSNFYYVYFIENDIKYYMYLYIKKKKSNYDIVFRENTSRYKEPFILNNAKWRFIRTEDYIENIFENVKILYNIRSKIYFNKSLNTNNPNRPPPYKIRGLVAKDNTCDNYATLLNNFFNSDEDLINNTKFKFEGYNNNYKITPYVKSENSIFNNIDGCLFLNYNIEQKKLLQERKNNKEITEVEYNEKLRLSKINNKVKLDPRTVGADPEKKLVYYKIQNPETQKYLYLDTTTNKIIWSDLYDENNKNENYKISEDDILPDNFLWIVQNSKYNDIQINEAIQEKQAVYNNMINQSIVNINKNITNKIYTQEIIHSEKNDKIIKNNEKFKIANEKIMNYVKNATKNNTVGKSEEEINRIEQEFLKEKLIEMKGGEVITMNTENIENINRLVQQLKFIKYNDYKLLINQLNIIKENSKNTLPSNFGYKNISNRMKLKYLDSISKTNMTMYIYFNPMSQGSTKFECNIQDILNFRSLEFDIESPQTENGDYTIFNFNNISVEIDNDTYPETNTKINNIEFNNRNNLRVNKRKTNKIFINFDSPGPEELKISQILINLPGIAELIINNKKSDVFVYYNSKPIFNKGKWLKPMKNTNKNTIYDLLSNYGLSKRNKKIYDFSIRLQNTDSKISKITKNHITEYITSFNNEIDSFYIKKNQLEDNIPYNSKIFYIANNTQVMYIVIYNNNNLNEIYEAPCNYSSILEKNDISNEEIYSYICKSLYTHIQILNKRNKSVNMNKIFDFITILYKNNKYNKLAQILNVTTRTSPSGYLLDNTNSELKIEINMKKLNDSYDLREGVGFNTVKIPNIITLIFDRLINEPGKEGQYIYTNMKYTDFIHISNLFEILPNIPFIKLDSFTEEQGKVYKTFFDKTSNIIKYILNVKNNKENRNIGNIEDIINAANDIIDYYFINYKTTSENKFNNELKLYLNTLLNSDLNITNYIIDLVLDICHKIQVRYNEYSVELNELLKNDNRFVDCIYKPASFVDILYNMCNYFSDPINNEDPGFFNITYGYHFKNELGVYLNNVEKDKTSISVVNKEYLVSFTDIIKNYSKIEKKLPERNIRKKELNEPYLVLLKDFNNDVKNILKKILNMKYANIKINKKPNREPDDTNIQKKLKNDIIEENKSVYLNYENINFTRNDSLRTYNKGDVILFKFIRNTQTNNLFNIINLLLPYKKTNENWQPFTELIDVNHKYKYLSNLVEKNLNIYGITNYNEIFKSNLIDTYVSSDKLLLKQVLPFKNDYSSVETKNICYIKLNNNQFYLHLNKYKYQVNIKKLINSNLYLIYRTINNINYYLQYVVKDDIYNYEWIKEESFLVDRLINKLLFISNTGMNIDDSIERIEITDEKMIEIDHLNRFSFMFSHINRFINNGDGDCNLLNTYNTIHNKNYKKIIHNNNILEVLDMCLNNSGDTFILKDKYGKISDSIGNFKYYFTNEECNSYIIYSPSHNSDDILVLNSNFEFEKIPANTISISDLINNPTVNSKYVVNLKYSLDKNIFEELDENCIKREKNRKLKIQDISDIEQLADQNRYFIYIINEETGLDKIIIDDYYNKENENVPDKEKACYIIPIKPINKLKILEKKEGKYIDLNLSLKSVSPNSEYFVIQNKKGEYLQAKTLIQYKKPLRINLDFVKTNIINSNYLFTIRNNIENIETINILKSNKKCLVGGQKLITTNSIKNEYLTNINNKFNQNSNYKDLCHNNTNVSFINYNTIETQDDVSYFECRDSCDKNETCSGFSLSNINGKNVCKTYEKKNDTSVLFYDCNKSLTENNDIGEIKNKIKIPQRNAEGNNVIIEEDVLYHNINLIDNALYYIESKKMNNSNNLYVNLNKLQSKYKNENNLKCIPIENINTENIYSDNIFRFNIQKNNITNGNVKFYNILSDDKFVLGSYNNNTIEVKITYDSENNKYIWNNGEEKWYLESTNDIYEYIVLEGKKEDEGAGFYCPYYQNGYKTMKVFKDKNQISVEGPDGDYIRIIPDEDISIFKNIKNINNIGIVDTNIINNYDGNIFLIPNKIHKDYYNLFTIFENKKFYLYLASDNLIKYTENTTIDNEEFLWKFNLYSNKINNARSFQILKGGKIINQDILIRKFPEDKDSKGPKKQNNKNKLSGGVTLKNLVHGNSYYIKSKNDEYICANKHYKNSNGNVNKIIAISINSKLATDPNKNNEYNKKFVRASIDLSNTDFNIFKKYKIDDDIIWKLIIEEGEKEKEYKFYNIKHNLYLTFSSEIDSFIINKTGSSIFYNIVKKGTNSNIIINNQVKNLDKIYELQLSNIKERNNWAFINPTNYTNNNPYTEKTVFSNLENGKIYRIINEGVKNNNETNTYLTINELNNELLIPYNEKTFTGKMNEDATLWKCIINDDNTYSFELVKTGQKLGDESGNLFKNIGNKLNFKNEEYIIDKKYLTDKFYIQHSTNEYYNILNSRNLNYNMCGFSNDINTYDNYATDNIKYTHKIANNSEWIITSKLYSEYKNSDIFTNESYYYLYPSKTNKIHYSFSYNYNTIYNTIYNETNRSTTENNVLQNLIETNLNSFKNSNGFTVGFEVNCKTIPSRELNKNNFALILDTETHYYTIRFINYSKKSTLVRILENTHKNKTIEGKKQNIKTTVENFDKLDFTTKGVGGNQKNEITMNINAPDIYTDTSDTNIFYLNEAKINITYDKEFLNIYINNKLITFFRKSDLLINQIYYTSLNECIWTNVKWWNHTKLINIPLWKTENIDNFIDDKPGIRFNSKINKNVKIECYIRKHTDDFFYIINDKNEYLSIIETTENALNYETKWSTDNSKDNCLWKLYDTNINLSKNINIIEGTPSTQNLQKHSFKCLNADLLTSANIENNTYFDNVDNSTNIMVKAKINKTTKLIDQTSNYTYSIIDVNSDEDNLNYKKCMWSHNKNGHTSIDYSSFDIGSHFSTDIWNIQYVLGVTPKIGDKFLVKYKSNKGIVRVDRIKAEYPTFGGLETTAHMRWLNWEKIKEFPLIKSQNNTYIEYQYNQDFEEGNVCISKNTDSSSPSLFSASCSNVGNANDCRGPAEYLENMENSVERLFIEGKTCDDFMYKNYALVKAATPANNVLSGGKQKGGSIWIAKDSLKPIPPATTPTPNIKGTNTWYFYLNSGANNKRIFTNIHNVKYIPSIMKPIDEELGEKWEQEIKQWTYDPNNASTKNIIENRIVNEYEYDGYIDDTTNNIIRAIILPKNFVLFYTDIESDSIINTENSGYIKGNFKTYNCDYKNIYIVKEKDYMGSLYSNFYVKIQTKKGKKITEKNILDNTQNRLNKCYDFISDRICIPDGNVSKTASNIIHSNYLLHNDNYLNMPSKLNIESTKLELSKKHPYRIITIYGKYLCDIFVNDSQFCEYHSSNKYSNIKSTEIIFQGQTNSIDLVKNATHYMHNVSFESLWTLEKSPNDSTYKILNTYTGKYLTKNLLDSTKISNEIPYLYIEFSESKYFKQQMSDLKKKQSSISYVNEDLYYIYYIENDTKMYLSFEDVLVNNKYTNSAKFGFSKEKPTGFIIKSATRNLDQITDETNDLPERITDLCYNKTKICIKNKSKIALFENNNLQCLNISYLFRKKVEDKYTNNNQYDIFNLVNKYNDNFLSVPHKGHYELMFYFPNILVKEIKFKFSGLFKPIKKYADDSPNNSEVRLINLDKWLENNDSFDFSKINNINIDTAENYKKLNIDSKPYFVVENSQISKEKIIRLSNINNKNSIIQFKIYCEEGFTLNYVEAYGEPMGDATFKTEKKIINNTANNFKQINLNKSLISTAKNIEFNTIKIKYIKPLKEFKEENTNSNKNIVSYKNNKPTIDNVISTSSKNFYFTLIFNPLLNAYMFYSNNNNYLTIQNTSYFKLIKLNINNISKNENQYYLQSLYNPDLYINLSESNLILGNSYHVFELISHKIETNNKYQTLSNINNSFLNNILYNLDDRIIYIQVKNESTTQKQYYHLMGDLTTTTTLKKDQNKAIPLLLKRTGENSWILKTIITQDFALEYRITDLRNISDNKNNLYAFKDKDSRTETGYFNLYYDYNTLPVRPYKNIKNLLSHNDINKKLRYTKKKYEEQLIRNKNYINRTNILNRIYLDDIITLSYSNEFLLYDGNKLTMSKQVSNNNNLFIKIKIDANVCKLWHLNEKKFVVFNILTNSFTLSNKVVEYNDIDLLHNIDSTDNNNIEYSLFGFMETAPRSRQFIYKILFYTLSGSTLYLNTIDPNTEIGFNYTTVYKYTGNYINITNIDKNPTTYNDYCKICKSNNSVEDNLIMDKTYNITDVADTIYLSLGKYKINISGPADVKGNYFVISNLEIDEDSFKKNLPVRNYKEKDQLKEIFGIKDDDIYLKMAIITISISSEKYNIIIWKKDKNSDKIIGRFEDRFNIPGNYSNSEFNILYDADNNKLQETEDRSYIFTTYTNPPKGTYIKINKLDFNFINKFKLSLFHIDNTDLQPDEELTDLQKNKKSNTKRLITTCAWGDCKDFELLETEKAQKYLNNINRLESTYNYKQLGGKLDTNMIHFIKNISTKPGENNKNYHNKINISSKYVTRNSSYFTEEELVDILFKKNDIIEFYKIFGKKGWTNSYNSIYSKKLFTIQKSLNEITDLDYYDSFRNIYPTSWLEKKFALNVQNIWKYNYWFEDNPHFRSLPNWKFELVQAIETRTANETLQIKLGGNKLNKCNIIKNPIIIFTIIIIGILILKHFKLI